MALTGSLDVSLRIRFKDALAHIYNALGYDVWGDTTPDDDEFVDVLVDKLSSFCGPESSYDDPLSWRELDRFFSLSDDEQRTLCLDVGP